MLLSRDTTRDARRGLQKLKTKIVMIKVDSFLKQKGIGRVRCSIQIQKDKVLGFNIDCVCLNISNEGNNRQYGYGLNNMQYHHTLNSETGTSKKEGALALLITSQLEVDATLGKWLLFGQRFSTTFTTFNAWIWRGKRGCRVALVVQRKVSSAVGKEEL